MLNKPVTFFFDHDLHPDTTRLCFLQEFAANGARHMVLSDGLLGMMLAQYRRKKAFVQELASFGMTFLDAHALFGAELDLNCPFPEARAEMLHKHIACFGICAELGVRTITFHVGSWFTINGVRTSVADHVDRIRASLDVLLPEAQKCGLTIAMENIWAPGTTPDVLLEIKKHYPGDELGFCFDSGHANLLAARIDDDRSVVFRDWRKDGFPAVKWEDQALEKMLPHLVNCHLSDNNGFTDQHLNLGRGNVDFSRIAALLKQAPRLQCVQAEIPIRWQEDGNGTSVRGVIEAMQAFVEQ